MNKTFKNFLSESEKEQSIQEHKSNLYMNTLDALEIVTGEKANTQGDELLVNNSPVAKVEEISDFIVIYFNRTLSRTALVDLQKEMQTTNNTAFNPRSRTMVVMP